MLFGLSWPWAQYAKVKTIGRKMKSCVCIKLLEHEFIFFICGLRQDDHALWMKPTLQYLLTAIGVQWRLKDNYLGFKIRNTTYFCAFFSDYFEGVLR